MLAFLTNISDSSIKNQISDRVAILAYFKYSLICLQTYLAWAKEAKHTENNWTTSIFLRDLSAESIFV